MTSAIVGTILIFINQWDAVLSNAPFSFSKALLTYIVPFMVYQYGRLKNA